MLKKTDNVCSFTSKKIALYSSNILEYIVEIFLFFIKLINFLYNIKL